MSLPLHEFHHAIGARFAELDGAEIVADYGDWLAGHKSLCEAAGIFDLSFRSRLCLVGADRARFLHGQVTNDVKKLRVGEGCYAAITTAKGKMESDLNIFNLPGELLLDFEPGLTEKISQRLEKFIVADDVQIVDVVPHYGLLSVQGPRAEEIIRALDFSPDIPAKPLDSVKIADATLGEIYLANNPRLGASGFDLFVPNNALGAVADKLIAAAKQIGGRATGWTAFETARIEAGIPRFGADMDETNIPLECGIESRAVSYSKGCYIGQEVINRIHSIGHVTRELRGLRLADDLKTLPARGDKLFLNGKEAGHVTSAVKSPALNANIALGYVRREANQTGNELTLRSAAGESPAKIVELPFVK
ncbi:MAG TPA: aminomethyltransferase family protein [Candidatus Paceibacterota bacterium]|nr:aminomethyltransferase family protein [Candidatus Paceibacterota bacterium]